MLTAAALVALPELGLKVLVEGPPGALEAEITWVHTTDLPDPSGYVGRSELVMTNGLWRRQASAADYVKHCRAAGAAGIVYGLLKDTPQTPPDLIDACTRADLLLLQLPIEVPFTAVSQAASDIRVTDHETPLVARARRADAFAEALSDGKRAAGVLEVLRGEYPGLPLALVDRTGALLAEAGTSLTDNDRQITATALTRHPVPMELVLDAATATCVPVGHGSPEAALLCLRPASALADAQQDALNQTAAYLGVEIARRHSVRAAEERFAHQLTDMILSGVGPPSEIASRLSTFGLHPGDTLIVLALSTRDGAETRGLAAATAAALSRRAVPAMVTEGSRDVVAICAWRHPPDELMDWCHSLAAELSARRPVVLATADPVSSTGHLRTALLEARRTNQLFARAGHDVSVARLADLPTYHTLLSRLDRQHLQDLILLLAPVREYDTKRGDDALETTLRMYLELDASPKATAEAMHLNINSVYRRLGLIRDLTRRDPSTLKGRLDLLLAIEADAYLEI